MLFVDMDQDYSPIDNTSQEKRIKSYRPISRIQKQDGTPQDEKMAVSPKVDTSGSPADVYFQQLQQAIAESKCDRPSLKELKQEVLADPNKLLPKGITLRADLVGDDRPTAPQLYRFLNKVQATAYSSIVILMCDR